MTIVVGSNTITTPVMLQELLDTTKNTMIPIAVTKGFGPRGAPKQTRYFGFLRVFRVRCAFHGSFNRYPVSTALSVQKRPKDEVRFVKRS
jgi:hypothetical protein